MGNPGRYRGSTGTDKVLPRVSGAQRKIDAERRGREEAQAEREGTCGTRDGVTKQSEEIETDREKEPTRERFLQPPVRESDRIHPIPS